MAVAPISDVWTVTAAAGQTRTVRGAGVTTWASVTIENDTGVSLYMTQGDTPPAGAADAWRIVPPGAVITMPLVAPAVSYRLAAAPTAGQTVQTILSADPAGVGGSTGQVNVQSGNLTVTGPVNVQTATGITLATAQGFATSAAIGIGLGTTGPINIPLVDSVQRVVLGYHGSGTNITVVVAGGTTGATYFRGFLAGDAQFGTGGDVISLAVAGKDASHAISIEASLNITIGSSTGGGTLVVSQSFAPPAASANDILPISYVAASVSTNKNLPVIDVGGKQVVNARPTALGVSNLIAAPAAGFALLLQYCTLTCELTTPNSICTIQSNGIVVSLFTVSNAGGAASFDFKGLNVPVGRGVDASIAASAAAWNVTLGYSVVPV